MPLPVPLALTSLGFAAAVAAASAWATPAGASPQAHDLAAVTAALAAPETPSSAAAPAATTAVQAATAATAAPTGAPSASDATARGCKRLVIVFTYAGATRPARATPALAQLSKWLGAHPDATVVVDGHADALGNDHGNLNLSKKRAATVAKVLTDDGVARERITVRGFGAYSPLEGEKEDAAQNRRVVVAVRGSSECPVFEEEVIGP